MVESDREKHTYKSRGNKFTTSGKTIYFLRKVKRSAKFPFLLLALAVFPVFSLPAVAAKKHQALYEEAFKLYRQLDSNQQKAKNPENWDLIGRTFYRIYRENPKGENAALSLFIAAKIHETKSRRFRSPRDGEKALRYSLELVRRYPKSTLADDSQFRAGRILERRGEKTRAYVAYRKIVRDMPGGDMYPRARKKLALLAKYKPKPSAGKSAPAPAAKKPGSAPPEKTAARGPAKPAPEGFAAVKKIRHWSTDTDDYTRVVIETDREVEFVSKLLGADPEIKAPPRLYVDLEKTVIDDSVNIEPITKGLLEKIKFHPNRPGVARVVLYIKDFESHKVFSLPKSKHHPFFRVVMDIKGSGARPEKIFAKDPPSYDEPQSGEPVLESRIPDGAIGSLKQALGLKVRTVVIDPGHGGHDPGAIGATGLKEKDVVLRIAKRLRDKLLKEGGEFGIENVYLTRSTDRFIPLEERTAIAKKKKADIFISIHCNAARTKKAHGIETYILGFTNDQTSLQLAARENTTTTKGLHALRNILKDYIMSSKIEESQAVAGHVQTSIVKNVSMKYKYVNDKGVKKAPFVVLIGADIPSLLVEASFLTNPREEKRLKTATYIERIVDGIIMGIKKYSEQTQKVS